jgi:polar amino acid transport system permease protein
MGGYMATVSETVRTRPAWADPKILRTLPWWAILILAAGIFLTYQILSNAKYNDTFIFLRAGVIVTLRMTLIAFPIATIIGLITGLMRTSKNVFLYHLATIYVESIRGIPMVVILLYFAFVLMPILVTAIKQTGEWGLSWGRDTFMASFFGKLGSFSIRTVSYEMRAIIGLAIGYGAFEAEVFRAGIQSIGRGQTEAARSLGMSYMQAMRYVILPQAIRRVLPPLGNDFIALLKDTALATVLAVPELTQLGRLRRASTFRSLETYNVVAFLYLAMTLFLSAVVRFMERTFKYEE